jgi:hypothetical protein
MVRANTEEALERLRDLTMDLSLIQGHSAAKKVADSLTELKRTSVTTATPSPTLVSDTARVRRSARHSWNRPSTRSSAAVGQETADGVDTPWRSSVVTDADEGPQP